MWGCIKAPLGSSLVLKAFLWGHFCVGEMGSESVFWSPSFQLSPFPARAILELFGNSEHGGSSCMWGCIKAPLGSSVVLKAFLWGHFCMGERVL